jgi:uncharacterized protein (DUF608 family)
MKVSRRNLLLGTAALGGAAQEQAPPAGAASKRSGQGSPSVQRSPEMPGRSFRSEALREIAFPLGGIGTGTVSLGGCGNFRDWEIFNRPNKGGILPFTFAALRLAGGGLKEPLIRVLERQPMPPYTGGSGVPRETALGLPRFRGAVFTGAYPFAHIRFEDSRLPVEASLGAFNPMAPLETDDSGLPVALLSYNLKSRATSKLDVALAFSIMNPVGYDGVARLRSRRAPFFGRNLNVFRNAGGLRGLFLTGQKHPPESSRYGSMALATTAEDVSSRLEWEHGAWWDEFQKWWDEFLAAGRFQNAPSKPSEDGSTEYATLAAHFTLNPGQTKPILFVLSWHFPNTENYWSRGSEHQGQPLRNHYGMRWPSAWEPAVYAAQNFDSLRDRSRRYRDVLYGSTLPPAVLDAVSSQASILRTNTVMVMEKKTTLAFEGCNDNGGCCPMNCTHVYNYEQALAHLYPDLERSMRETDFLVNMRLDGSMSFRTPVPLQQGGNRIHPAADGQMGCVMKVYREWRLSGDDEWLRKLWPQVKRALEYAWVNWDADRDGVMEGEQHNTYDIEFYGPNSMMGTLYLGALAAAARMARYLGDQTAAEHYRRLFEEGGPRLDRMLWNGEYYVQKVDESQEKAAKYQYGEGCLSDQLLGQWFAEVVDLGKLLPHEHLRTALSSIFRYNFRDGFAEFPNTQRIYALNDEQGLLLCSWPKGKRPALPFVYSDEVWTGIEYQVAAHLIYEGMVKEGLAIVEAVRNRHDGIRRNPWNEFECGHHYARAMASWSLLSALSGFACSVPDKELSFRPRLRRADFRCLFSSGTAWGSYSQTLAAQRLEAAVTVEGGTLELATLRTPYGRTRTKLTSSAAATVTVAGGEAAIRFDPQLRLTRGQSVKIVLA